MNNDRTLSLSSIRSMIVDARNVIADAEERIRMAHERLDDLLLAESLFLRLVGPQSEIDSATVDRKVDEGFKLTGDVNPFKPGTNKAYMYQALSEAGSVWFTANEVQARATKLKGADVPMSSVSPSLTEMKDEGVVVRVGLRVALKSRLQGNDAHIGGADSASEASQPDLSPTERQLLTIAAVAV